MRKEISCPENGCCCWPTEAFIPVRQEEELLLLCPRQHPYGLGIFVQRDLLSDEEAKRFRETLGTA